MPKKTWTPGAMRAARPADYRALGSCSVQSWGGYVQIYRRNGEYRGDTAFFDGDRDLEQLKEMHEALGRAIAVLEVQKATDEREAEPKSRFERDPEIG